MSSTSDKVTGTTNEYAGKARQEVGKIFGDNKMQAEGLMQEAKGHAQQVKGEAKENLKEAVDKA